MVKLPFICEKWENPAAVLLRKQKNRVPYSTGTIYLILFVLFFGLLCLSFILLACIWSRKTLKDKDEDDSMCAEEVGQPSQFST
jgi:hypothetical protein